MLIEDAALRHWVDNFYGYGSWQSPFWFVSYEEDGGDLPEDVADRLNYFYRNHAHGDGALCDIRELYKQVPLRREGPKASSYPNLHAYRFESNAVLHGLWKNLIAFVHGYNGKKLPDLLSYQQHNFASPSIQSEALIPLYPLPSTHNHAWYYSWLDLPQVGFLKSRTLYEEYFFEPRMHHILSNIKRYKPEVLLMYGMDNIIALKESVQEFCHEVKFSMIKATASTTMENRIPQYHRADINGTTFLITTQVPTLRHNRVETGFDWEQFGKKVKAG